MTLILVTSTVAENRPCICWLEAAEVSRVGAFQKAGWDLLRELLILRDENPIEFEGLLEVWGLGLDFESLLNESAASPGPDARFLGLAQGLDRATHRGPVPSNLKPLAESVVLAWDSLCQEADVVAVQLEFECSRWAACAYMREFELIEPKSFGSLSVLTGILAQRECAANEILDQQKRSVALLLRRSLTDSRDGDEPSSYELYARAKQIAGRGVLQTRHLVAVLAGDTSFAAHRWLVESEFDLEELVRCCSLPLLAEPDLPAYSTFNECYKLGPRTPGGGSSPAWTWYDSYQQKGWALWRAWNRRDSQASYAWLETFQKSPSTASDFLGFSHWDFQFVELALTLKSAKLAAQTLIPRIEDVERAWWDWVRRDSEILTFEGESPEPAGLLSPSLMLSCSEHSNGESLPLLRSLLKIPTNGAYRLLVEQEIAVSKLVKRLELLQTPQESEMTLAHWLKESLEIAKDGLLEGGAVSIQTQHLLVAFLRKPESAAGQILSKLGIEPQSLRTLSNAPPRNSEFPL